MKVKRRGQGQSWGATLTGPPLDLTCTPRPLPLGPGLFHCSICLQKVLPSLKVTWHLWVYFSHKSKLFPTVPERSLCVSHHAQLCAPGRACALPGTMSASSSDWTRSSTGRLPCGALRKAQVCNGQSLHFKLLGPGYRPHSGSPGVITEVGIGQLIHIFQDIASNFILFLWWGACHPACHRWQGREGVPVLCAPPG